MTKLINLEQFRNGNADDRMHMKLSEKVQVLVHRVNTTSDSDEDIAKFIIDSFADGGLLETWNNLGHHGWCRMITMMAESEVWERNNELRRVR